jgi:hypothetical protein
MYISGAIVPKVPSDASLLDSRRSHHGVQVEQALSGQTIESPCMNTRGLETNKETM